MDPGVIYSQMVEVSKRKRRLQEENETYNYTLKKIENIIEECNNATKNLAESLEKFELGLSIGGQPVAQNRIQRSSENLEEIIEGYNEIKIEIKNQIDTNNIKISEYSSKYQTLQRQYNQANKK